MQINVERISRDLEAIAAITETPENGSSRPTFSAEWIAARDYVIEEAKAAGCAVRIDAAGNVHLRPTAIGWDRKVWLSGSHIDSVPHGGTFDGVTGVVVPLEILRAAHEAKRIIPLELIIFAEEEGTTFNLGMLGSRAWAGTLSAEELAKLRNRDGKSPLEAGRACGVDPDRLATDRLDPGKYVGLIEVHVEQGPAMWERNIPLAIVTTINGRRQFACTIRGVANHAGSTPMDYRRDALAAAAECVVALEKLPRELSPQTVCTVGRLNVSPNALNVIADEVAFYVDFRSPDNAVLERGTSQIHTLIESICSRRKVGASLTQTEALPAVALDAGMIGALRTAAKRIGLDDMYETSSGALHDAAILAPLLPTAMVFVASRDGISHNPGEFSRMEDIALAAKLLAEVVTHDAG